MTNIYGLEVGESLDNMTDIPVIKVQDPTMPISGVDSNSLIYRYTPDPNTPNIKWNGKEISEAQPAETGLFAQDGYVRLNQGDVVTYTNTFGQTVKIEATSYIPDFKLQANKFSVGNISTRRPSADFSISIEGENKPTYLAFTDLDYSDNVGIKKDDISNIVVKEDTKITYTEKDGYLFFHGLQGSNRTTKQDQSVWISLLLKSAKTSVKVLTGNSTLIEIEKTILFPEGEDIAIGSVTVKYITDDGKVLEDTADVVRNVHVDTPYDTEEKVFDGYEFLRMDGASAPADGVVTEGEKHVIYVYTVTKPVDPQEPPKPAVPQDPPKGPEKPIIPDLKNPVINNHTSPITGDSSNILFYSYMTLIAGGLVILTKKRKED